MPVFIIHHATAFAQTMSKYGLVGVDPPSSYPVLLSFMPDSDLKEPLVENAAIVTVQQAAKFLASVPVGALTSIDGTITSVLTNKLKSATVPSTIVAAKAGPSNLILTAADGGTLVVALSVPTGFKIGNKLSLNGKEYTVTVIGTSDTVLTAPDPITNIEGAIAIVEDKPPVLPGIDNIPVDPSKLQVSAKIAEIEDDKDHVLDVERSI